MLGNYLLIPGGVGAAYFYPHSCRAGETRRPRSSRAGETQAAGFEETHLSLVLTLPGGEQAPGPGQGGRGGERTLHRQEGESRLLLSTYCVHARSLLGSLHLASRISLSILEPHGAALSPVSFACLFTRSLSHQDH